MTIDSTSNPPSRAATPSPASASAPASGSAPAGVAPAPLRVAVAGLGLRGLAHAAALSTLENVTLVGIADPRRAARRNAAGAGFTARSFTRFDRLLARAKPEAVFISVPVGMRSVLALQALEAGAAVFIERPIALAFDETRRVAEAARRAGRPLACSHPLPYHPIFARACEAVRDQTIGTLREIRASVYVSRVFSARAAGRLTGGQGGGVIAHAALDLLALLVRMLGMPIEARAQTHRLYGEYEDEFHARLPLEGGGTLGLDCSWSVPGYPRPATVIEIEGSLGHLLVSDDALEIDDAGGGHRRWTDADLPQPSRFDLEGEARWSEDAAFVQWVAGGPMPLGAPIEALRAHAVMQALEASARDGGKPARMPEGLAS